MTTKIALAAAATTVSIVLPLSSLATPAGAASAPPPSTCQGELVCEAVSELAALHAAVEELVPQAGLANSLVAKVDAATSSVLADRPATAVNQLDAFDNELTAADQAGKVSTTVANIIKGMNDTVKQGPIAALRG